MKPFVFLLFLLLASCTTKNTPRDVLPKDKMVTIMGDVYLLEMHYQKKYGAPANYQKHLKMALKKLLTSHGTTQSNYEESFNYYASDPEAFVQMNEEVIENYNAKLHRK